ncbi:MAG: ABC transporter permease [Desulfobacteraceae bacterium]|nr:ABC transporter permease [Desulfobacteraceae bacterium]
MAGGELTGSTRYYVAMKCGRFLLGFIVVCTLHFSLPRLMPGSPVFAMLGPDVIGLSEKDYAALEAELGLHDSLPVQFARYFVNIVSGDFGFSYFYHLPVKKVVLIHLKPTLMLLLPSVVLSSLLACILGAVAGRFSGRAGDLVFTPLFLFLYAMPAFLLAMVSLDLFAFRLDWFPLGGLKGMDTGGCSPGHVLDVMRHLFLPVVVLSLSSTAAKFLVMRNSVFSSKHQGYVLYARARGLGEGRILFVHILREAVLPMISLVGLHVAFIMSGSLLVEIVFSINGMGALIHEAAMNRDYPVLNTCFLFLTLVVLTVNMVTDVLCGILDPRVRV